MNDFLLGAYQLACGLLFLMLSAILIYHRLFSRWVKFAMAFFASYVIGSYAFFGRVPDLLDAAVLWPLCVFLFFFGVPACVSYGVFRQLSGSQIGAAATGYLVALLAVVFFLGFGQKPQVQILLVSLPYLLFYIGTPLVIGMCLYRGLSCSSILGVFIVFCFCLLGMMVATTNYYDMPFGLFYDLEPHTRAWIEIASAVLAVAGVPGIVGYGLMHGWESRVVFGATMLGVVAIGLVGLLVRLTIGYELGWIAWN